MDFNHKINKKPFTSYSLSVGLLQQCYPECRGGVALREAQSGTDAGQAVVDGNRSPVALLPDVKLEGPPVHAVPPPVLVRRANLGVWSKGKSWEQY